MQKDWGKFKTTASYLRRVIMSALNSIILVLASKCSVTIDVEKGKLVEKQIDGEILFLDKTIW